MSGVEVVGANPLAEKGIELVVDGWDPMLARSILETVKTTYLAAIERKADMIIEGIDTLIADDGNSSASSSDS